MDTPLHARSARPSPLCRAASWPRGARAFSLLEVMVAVALLAIGMTVLLEVQTRSIQLAQEAREMTIATMLARGKLLDCQTDLTKKGFSIGDYDEEGDFSDDGFAQYFWECHAYKPDMPVADAGDITEGLGAAAGGDTASAAQEQGDIGMGMIAPILAQMSGILGDSIRELVVIIRWGEGKDMQEMRVTTHVIDKTAVNQVAGMISQQSQALNRNPANPANPLDPANPSNPSNPSNPRQPSRVPGGGK